MFIYKPISSGNESLVFSIFENHHAQLVDTPKTHGNTKRIMSKVQKVGGARSGIFPITYKQVNFPVADVRCCKTLELDFLQSTQNQLKHHVGLSRFYAVFSIEKLVKKMQIIVQKILKTSDSLPGEIGHNVKVVSWYPMYFG